MALTAEQQAGMDKVYNTLLGRGYTDATAKVEIERLMNQKGVSSNFKQAMVSPVQATATNPAQPVNNAPVIQPVAPVEQKQPAVTVQPVAPVKTEAAPVSPVVPPVATVQPNVVQNQPTPTAAPVAPTVPTPAKPEVAQVTAGGVTKERAVQIGQNLIEGTRNSPELFKDRASFDQAYGYGDKTPGEQAVLDTAWNNLKPKADELYNQLTDGSLSSMSAPKTAQGNLAMYRYNNVQRYKTYSPSQLAKAIGEDRGILFGSQAYQDLEKLNPDLVNEANNIRKTNNLIGIMTGNVSGKNTVNYTSAVETFNALLTDDTKKTGAKTLKEIIAELEDASGTKAKKDQMASEQIELNKDMKAYNQIESDVDSELSGTGATDSYRRALIAQRGKTILNSIQARQDVIDQLKGQISDDFKMAQFAYQERSSQLKSEQEQKKTIDDRVFQLMKDQMDFTQQKGYLASQTDEAIRLAKAKAMMDGGPEPIQLDTGNAITLWDPSTKSVIASFAKEMTGDRYQEIPGSKTVVYDKKEGRNVNVKELANAAIGSGRTDVGNPMLQTKFTGTGSIVDTGLFAGTESKDETGSTSSRPIQMDAAVADKLKLAVEDLVNNTPNGIILGDSYRSEEEQKSKVDQGVSWTMDSRHRNGLAIDMYANGIQYSDNAGQKDYIEKYIKPVMEKYGFEQKHFGKGDYGHFEYTGIGQEQAQKEAGLLVNDPYLGSLLENSGRSASNFKGTEAVKFENRELFQEFMKDGKIDAALNLIDLPAGLQAAKDSGRIITDNVPELMNDVSNVSLAGQEFGWNVPYEEALSNFAKNDKTFKLTGVTAKIERTFAELRNKLFGASLTDNEKSNSETFIPKQSDSLPTIMAKMKGLYELSVRNEERTPFVAMGATPDQLQKNEYIKSRIAKRMEDIDFVLDTKKSTNGKTIFTAVKPAIVFETIANKISSARNQDERKTIVKAAKEKLAQLGFINQDGLVNAVYQNRDDLWEKLQDAGALEEIFSK